MTDAILVLNAGSSSVKFSLFERESELQLLAHGQVSDITGQPSFHVTELQGETVQEDARGAKGYDAAIEVIIKWCENHTRGCKIVAVAHRIVHGGISFVKSVRIDAEVLTGIRALCPMAPLHQPHNIAAVEIAQKHLPQIPQIACFDTAFHATHAALFRDFALPFPIVQKGVRKYGFHGLSYEWIARVLQTELGSPQTGRVVVAHLGSGASLCAIKDGISIDTTMGMTALDGLPMGTRSGAIDPGAILFMQRELGLTPQQIEHMLYEESGLKALSQLTNDVENLISSDDPKAAFALDYFALKVSQFTSAMAASLGGIDALVFTGGIGENATSLRAAIVQRLDFLKIPSIRVIPANEERMMAIHTRSLLEQPPG